MRAGAADRKKTKNITKQNGARGAGHDQWMCDDKDDDDKCGVPQRSSAFHQRAFICLLCGKPLGPSDVHSEPVVLLSEIDTY